jgi:2-polyprenyl-3-methyl-5-hydroxy-6-metoxy-1,4-benzoquinol methylase
MRPFYFEYAHLYDLISGKESFDRMQGLRKILVRFNFPFKILDAGCGTGNYTKFLNDLGFNCLGIDLSDKLLEVAKSKFPTILFMQGNLLDLNH